MRGIFRHVTRPLRTAFALSVILAAELLLFTPATLYLGNVDEFANSLADILRIFSLGALPLLSVLLIVAAFLPRRHHVYYTTFLAVLVILLWGQANILTWDYGLLNGEPVDWGIDVWRGWLDSAIWIASLVFGMCYVRRVNATITHLAYMLAALQCVALATSLRMAVTVSSSVDANDFEQSLHFSTGRNVLHIVLDGFQADIFDEIISAENGGQLFRDALPGFIFYREHSGAFPTTYMSIPAYMGGKIYDNSIPKREFMRATLAEHSILKRAHDAGFDVHLVGPSELIAYYRDAPHDAAFAIPAGFPAAREFAPYADAAMLLDLTLFRSAPHFLKRTIYNDQQWRLSPLVLQSEQSRFRYFSHTAYVRVLAQQLSVDLEEPVYKLLHLMNTHWPMVVDAQCRFKPGPYMTSRTSALDQARCSLAAVVELLESMRAHGIYDDALVIVMADHGAQLPPPRFAPSQAAGNVIVDPWIAAQATPLLALKWPSSNTGFQISDAPTALTDIPATIAAELALEPPALGTPISEINAEQSRERRFYAYEWRREDWQSDYAGDIQEFVITGSLYTGDWRLGRRFAAPAQ